MVMPSRGDIFWVNLDPTVGSEIRKKRPAVVVSNNAANKRYDHVTVLPLTSKNTTKVEPFQIFLSQEESSLKKDSKALAEQIRTISKLRLGQWVGHLGLESIQKINQAVKIHLDLSE